VRWILCGRVVRCKTRNLDHVKVMRVEEITTLRQAEDGWVSSEVMMRLPRTPDLFSPDCRKTLQINEARIVSRFGWGLAKTIENHGLAKFKTNLQRVSPTSITTLYEAPNPFHSRARGFLTS
jgi:hypothetical protein